MIAKQIADYMENNSIKQIDICRKTGFVPQQLSQMLHGKRSIKIEEYLQICSALDVPFEMFMPQKVSNLNES